jgi:hypothetical protein
MRYAPSFAGGRVAERFRLGPYRCELVTDTEQLPDLLGAIRYTHVLVVLDAEGICLYITAEGNTMRAILGGGSHFLCAYPGEGCVRLADGDEYAGLERFRAAASDAVKRHFKLPDDTSAIPDEGGSLASSAGGRGGSSHDAGQVAG